MAGPSAAAAGVTEDAPRAPEPLARRINELLASAGTEQDPVARHLAAAEHTVARLLRDQSTSRASALDLLAADALATYAFELAADEPDAVPALAERAMARFAALAAAAEPPAAAPPEPGAPSVQRTAVDSPEL